MKKNLLLATAIMATGSGVVFAGPVITFNPVNSIAGNPNGIVGWGFDVQPDPARWISFVGSLTLSETNPSVGVYTDFIGSQGGPVNAVLAPSSPDWVQVFDSVLQTGIGSFAIDPGAIAGSSDSGVIRVLYDSFAGDPNSCSGCASTPGFVDRTFTVTVAAPNSSAPEPAAWLLVFCGAGLLAVLMCLTAARSNSCKPLATGRACSAPVAK